MEYGLQRPPHYRHRSLPGKGEEHITEELQQNVKHYTDRGWKVFPARGKQPDIRGWKEQATDNLETIERSGWFEEGENVAIVTGSPSGIVVLDFDLKEHHDNPDPIIQQAEAHLGKLPDTFCVLSGNSGAHLYFALPADSELRNMTGILDLPVDVRGNGGYIIAPPSIHPKTRQFYSVVDASDLAELPEEWLEHLSQRQSRRPERRRKFASRKDEAPWKEGERNDNLFRHLSGRVNEVASHEQLLAEAHEANRHHSSSPLSESEVEATANSVWSRYGLDVSAHLTARELDLNKPGRIAPEAVEHIFKDFAIVHTNGKAAIVDTRDYTFYSFNDAKEAFQHKQVPPTANSKKPVNAMEYWIKNTHRRYSRPVYRPGGGERSDELNLWRGYTVEPDPGGNCEAFYRHLHENVGDGDTRFSEYLLNWMAQLIQFPERKLGKVPVLTGEQGSGKSLVGQVLGALYREPHFVQVNDVGKLTARFNTQLTAAQFVLADEAIWGGDIKSRNQLKSLVTDPQIQIEPKGLNAYQVNSYLRLMITSNEDWAAPVESRDRRYVTIPVGNGRRNDREFFAELLRQLKEEGGYGRLLYDLENRDISDVDWDDVPMDEGHVEMLIRGLDDVGQWIHDSLSLFAPADSEDEAAAPEVFRGEKFTYFLDRTDAANGFVAKQTAFTRYREYRRSKGLPLHLSQQAFGKRLAKYLRLKTGKTLDSREDEYGYQRRRATSYEFDSVEEMKRQFAEAVGAPTSELFPD